MSRISRLDCWIRVLRSNGYEGGPDRAQAIAGFLVDNMFYKPSQLTGVEQVESWPGAHKLRNEELQVIIDIAAQGRPRSRCDSTKFAVPCTAMHLLL